MNTHVQIHCTKNTHCQDKTDIQGGKENDALERLVAKHHLGY